MKKMEPAVTTVTLNSPTVGAGATGSFYVDLSQVASLINRRFYRQGINWAVAGMKVLTAPNFSGSLTVMKIPTTWVAFQAYKAAFDAWNKQQMEAIEESGAESAVAAFRDFKIFADTTHVAAGYAANLLPLDGRNPAQPYAVGEWEPSQIVIPQQGGANPGVERSLHMVGINVNGAVSRGIIEGYADSRAFPHSPDPVSPDLSSTQNWMARMFDVAQTFDDVLDNATDRNDNLPYPQADYPGGANQAPTLEIHDITSISATTIGGQSRVKGGQFPCGLIRFDWAPSSDNPTSVNFAVQIDLVPGMHRGYMCEKMLEA
jgi:hypothetical protein